MSRDTSVGIVTGYGLDVRLLIPCRSRDFSLLRNFLTGSEVHISYPVGTGGSFFGGKAAGA
jgi:hypothetical protein